jgi:hypothetical protein
MTVEPHLKILLSVALGRVQHPLILTQVHCLGFSPQGELSQAVGRGCLAHGRGSKSRGAAAVPAPGTKVRPKGTIGNGPAVLPSVTATLGVATRVATVGTRVAVLPTAGTWATGLVLTNPVSRQGTLFWGPIACGWAGFLLEPLGVASNNSLEVLSSSVSSNPGECL